MYRWVFFIIIVVPVTFYFAFDAVKRVNVKFCHFRFYLYSFYVKYAYAKLVLNVYDRVKAERWWGTMLDGLVCQILNPLKINVCLFAHLKSHTQEEWRMGFGAFVSLLNEL